jgi:SAM (Sterile alpha motif) domain-containing protein
MDVGGWLRKLGLEQYEAAFRENRIDDTVLPTGDRLRRGGRCLLRRGREIERDTHDVGIFDVEQSGLWVEIIGPAAQAAADHLLAQQLGAEGSDTEDVGHRVGVPAFGQHRDRDDASYLFAESPCAADGVHHLAQQLALAGFVLHATCPFARGTLALELFDLRAGGVAKPLVERVAGFDLARVDQ